jgi:hypothetical protein
MPKPYYFRQPRIAGCRRVPMHTAVVDAIEAKIQAELRRYPGVSRSFVIANALAFTFGVEIPSYKREAGEAPQIRLVKSDGKRRRRAVA